MEKNENIEVLKTNEEEQIRKKKKKIIDLILNYKESLKQKDKNIIDDKEVKSQIENEFNDKIITENEKTILLSIIDNIKNEKIISFDINNEILSSILNINLNFNNEYIDKIEDKINSFRKIIKVIKQEEELSKDTSFDNKNISDKIIIEGVENIAKLRKNTERKVIELYDEISKIIKNEDNTEKINNFLEEIIELKKQLEEYNNKNKMGNNNESGPLNIKDNKNSIEQKGQEEELKLVMEELDKIKKSSRNFNQLQDAIFSQKEINIHAIELFKEKKENLKGKIKSLLAKIQTLIFNNPNSNVKEVDKIIEDIDEINNSLETNYKKEYNEKVSKIESKIVEFNLELDKFEKNNVGEEDFDEQKKYLKSKLKDLTIDA